MPVPLSPQAQQSLQDPYGYLGAFAGAPSWLTSIARFLGPNPQSPTGFGTVLPMNRLAMRVVEEAEGAMASRAPGILRYVSEHPTVVKVFPASSEQVQAWPGMGRFFPRTWEALFAHGKDLPKGVRAELPLPGVSPEAQIVMHEGFVHPAQRMANLYQAGGELAGKPFPGLEWNPANPVMRKMLKPMWDINEKMWRPNRLHQVFGSHTNEELLPHWIHESPYVRVSDWDTFQRALARYFGHP